MHILLLLGILLALVAGPSLWVRRVMRRYARPADRYGRDGRETARRLLDGMGLGDVTVEVTEAGDHYDPEARAVRLSPDNYSGRSLTAVTIAAHEVGHALQDAEGFAPLKWRSRMVRWVGPVEKTGAVLMMATPIIIGITRLPMAGLLMLFGGLLTLG
ncbi:MAG: zinc metallopeptidase, partial [Gammaproteobacteria bacterium]|nr:zinc metallopeptidase [Gammaproteobacteria bacterium]